MRLAPFGYFGTTVDVNTAEVSKCNTTILTHQVKIIADIFFAQLAHACPLLGALVFGHEYPLADEESTLPQFCFIRGEQRDSLGRVQTVAVQVSKQVLRATQPETTVLELDPFVETWQRWAAKVWS
jgi:hypothetical protein